MSNHIRWFLNFLSLPLSYLFWVDLQQFVDWSSVFVSIKLQPQNVRVPLLLRVAVVPRELAETQAEQNMLQEKHVRGEISALVSWGEMRNAFHVSAVCTLFYRTVHKENFSAHLLFDVHHIDPLKANSNIDSFELSPLEDPLRWFVNLTKEETTPDWKKSTYLSLPFEF